MSGSGSGSSSSGFGLEDWLRRQRGKDAPKRTFVNEYIQSEANFLAKVAHMITTFRRWGHLGAKTDPLGLAHPAELPERLRLESFGFTDTQLRSGKPVDVSKIAPHFEHGFGSTARCLPLEHLYRRLVDVYAVSHASNSTHTQAADTEC